MGNIDLKKTAIGLKSLVLLPPKGGAFHCWKGRSDLWLREERNICRSQTPWKISSVGAAYSERPQGRYRLYEALLFKGDRGLQRGRAYGAAEK